MFSDRYIDYLVFIEERLEDGPRTQHLSLEVDLSKFSGIRQNDLCSGALSSFSDAGSLEAAARFIAADIGDNNALSACTHRLPDDLADHFLV